jgi:hypothetical protein
MSNYPIKDRSARTGSNLRGGSLLAQRQAELARERQLHERLARERFADTRKLFSKQELKRMSNVAAAIGREWRQASVKVDGDSSRIAALKSAARRKLDRAWGREVPKLAKARTLRRAQMREHRKISADVIAYQLKPRHHIEWGDIAPFTNGTDFLPPFASFDVQTVDRDSLIVRNDSFANPQTGHLVNNFDYDQDEHTSFGAGLWGILVIRGASNWAACGVTYTVPQDGRLQVSAVLRNFYNKLMYSVTDNWGFSSADVGISVELFVVVVRGTKVIYMPTLVRNTWFASDGDDKSVTESEIDDAVPFTITASTEERFNANEQVLVLAGSNVYVGTKIDDMHCRADVVLWWGLQRLSIGMAEDIIT